MADALLNLDTLVERKIVKVDGKPYELRTPGELSLLEFHRIGKLGETLEPLFAQEDSLTLDQVGTLATALDELCRAVFIAPPEVHAALREGHKLQIVNVFIELQRGAKVTAPEKTASAESVVPAVPSTGESTSPAS